MTENPSKGSESLDKEMLQTLSHSNMDRENLNELVRIVSELRKQGMQRARILLKGIPRPDGITLSAFVDADRLSGILTQVLTKTPRLQGVVVFPYGIPRPEVFQVNVDLGESVQAGIATGVGIAA